MSQHAVDSNVAALNKFLHAYVRTTLKDACAQTQHPDDPQPQLVVWLYRLGKWKMLSDQAVQGLWAAKRLQPNRSLCGLLLKDLFNLNSAQYESVRKNFETRLSSSVSGIYEAKEVENKFAIVVQLPDTLAFDKGLMYASGATLAALAIGGAAVHGLSGSRKAKAVSEVPTHSETYIESLLAKVTTLEAENNKLQAKVNQSGPEQDAARLSGDDQGHAQLKAELFNLKEENARLKASENSVKVLRVQNTGSLQKNEEVCAERNSAWQARIEKCLKEKETLAALIVSYERRIDTLYQKWEPKPQVIYGVTVGDPHGVDEFIVTVDLGMSNQQYDIPHGVSESLTTDKWKLNILAAEGQTPGQSLAVLCSDQPELARASGLIRLFRKTPFEVHCMSGTSLYCNSVFKVFEVRVNAAIMNLKEHDKIARNVRKCGKVFEINFEHLVIPYLKIEQQWMDLAKRFIARADKLCIMIDDEKIIVTKPLFSLGGGAPSNGELVNSLLLIEETYTDLYLTFTITKNTVQQLETDATYTKKFGRIYYVSKESNVGAIGNRFVQGSPPYFSLPTKVELES